MQLVYFYVLAMLDNSKMLVVKCKKIGQKIKTIIKEKRYGIRQS